MLQKKLFHYPNKFFFLIFFNIISLIFNNNSYLEKELNLDYTHSLALINGNVFIIHKNGVKVYDYNYSITIYEYNFGGIPIISSEDDNNFTSIIQCNDNEQYVIAIIKDNIYIFSAKGQYLSHKPINLFSDFLSNNYYKYYSFLYYKYLNNIYYFILSFINNEGKIKIIELQLDKNYNINSKLIFHNITDEIIRVISDSISCHIMDYSNSNVLGCVYGKNISNSIDNKIMLILFESENNFKMINETVIYSTYINIKNLFVKTTIGEDKSKLFFNIYDKDSTNIEMHVFDLTSFKLKHINNAQCAINTSKFNIEYFKYTDQYITSCQINSGISLLIIKYNSNVDSIEIGSYASIESKNCSLINFDILLLVYGKKYSIIGNCICNNDNTQIYNFPSHLSFDLVIIPSDEPDLSILNNSSFINYQTFAIENTDSFDTSYSELNIIQTSESINSSEPNIIKQTESIKLNYKCPINCLECNEDILPLNLCIQCNEEEGYYKSIPTIINGTKYYKCYNQETKPVNYYFNQENKYYEPCYSKCKTCDFQGNEEINNCTSCKNSYIFQPNEINSTNCVLKCRYYYYFSFEQYFCTENNQCPLEASLLIKNRSQCIDNCKKDKEYQFRYNYECLSKCPEDTIENKDNVCEMKNKKKCYSYTDFLQNVDFDSLKSDNFKILIKKYITGFNGSDYHVDFYQSQNYTLTIYKKTECLKELGMTSSIIDFGECYKKIQKQYNLENNNLIVLIADFFDDKKLVKTLFYFFDPNIGTNLTIGEICSDNSLIIEKSLNYYQELNIEQAKFFENQDINVFNSSDIFYNDLCYFFKSPNGKDVPIKDRIKLFYPNVTFCEDGCSNIGVNLTSMKAICECKMKDILSGRKDVAKFIGLEDFTEFFEEISLNVITCYKTIIQLKYFVKCYGGFITMFFIIIQTIYVIIAIRKSIVKMKVITFWILENYNNFLNSHRIITSPPKRKKKSPHIVIYSENSNSQNDTKYKLNQFKSTFEPKNSNNKINSFEDSKIRNDFNNLNIKSNINLKISEDKKIDLEEYLLTSLDDLDFDKAVVKENRTFCGMFFDRLIVKQMIINLFYSNNWIIPRSIKIILFIIKIDLYIVVNALFYNEDYISNLYYSNKKETFLSFIPRSLNRIIYTSLVSTVLDFMISLLFPTEHKIKNILIRKKNNIKEMKIKIIESMKKIINNYYILIILSYVITIISWFYISCFNNVYPYIKNEWIKSSIVIIVVKQIISFAGCFLFTILRFVSIKLKSEKLFRLSNYLFK